MGFPEDITVAVITHNSLNKLQNAIRSIVDAGCIEKKIIVIDVASTDNTISHIEKKWPSIKIVGLKKNVGPNPARNTGILKAKTPYVLIMDSDVTIKNDTVNLLRNGMEQNNSIAITSPIVLDAKKPNLIQYGGTGLHFLCEATNFWRNKRLADRGSNTADIICASGNALLISRSIALKIGLFDEHYFFGKDDGDFTFRINLAGYKIREIPKAIVYHDSGARGKIFFFYQIRNRWYFILKNYEKRTIFTLLPALFIHEIFQFFVISLMGYYSDYVRAIGGIVDLLPTIKKGRLRISELRKNHDSQILCAGEIVVPDKILKWKILGCLKKFYEDLLSFYWEVVQKAI